MRRVLIVLFAVLFASSVLGCAVVPPEEYDDNRGGGRDYGSD